MATLTERLPLPLLLLLLLLLLLRLSPRSVVPTVGQQSKLSSPKAEKEAAAASCPRATRTRFVGIGFVNLCRGDKFYQGSVANTTRPRGAVNHGDERHTPQKEKEEEVEEEEGEGRGGFVVVLRARSLTARLVLRVDRPPRMVPL